MPSRALLGMRVMSHVSWILRYQQAGCLFFFWSEKRKKWEEEKTTLYYLPTYYGSGPLWRSCSESLKVKENVFLLLNSIRARGGGFTRRALGSSMTESPLLRLSAAVTHFNSTLFLSHWKPSTMTFNKGRRVKTWLFLHILSPRLGRGPSKGINHCSLTALPSGDDLSLFFVPRNDTLTLKWVCINFTFSCCVCFCKKKVATQVQKTCQM